MQLGLAADMSPPMRIEPLRFADQLGAMRVLNRSASSSNDHQ